MDTPHRPEPMTVAQFLDWRAPDGHDRLWQLVDGELIQMSPTSTDHAAIQAVAVALFYNHLRAHRPDCRVYAAPGVQPRGRAAINARIPDIAIACGEEGGEQRSLLTAPRVIVEILSPSNEQLTRGNVWSYISIPTVREVLLLESTRIGGELLRRDEDSAWPPDPLPLAADDRVELTSLGFACPVSDFYAMSRLAPRP